jgi:DHA1 family tetracycline resistance protein-like MFS transporter
VSPAPKPARGAALAFIFVTVALDMLAFGIVIPVLPKLILGFRGGDVASAAGWQALFGTVFAGLQFACAPALGALSDRFGRRPVILLSNLALGLDYLLIALALNLWWLLVGRTIAGLCSASISVPNAYIADVTPPERRAASYGLIGAAFGLGFILGPALGGIAGEVDPRLPFWIAAGLSLANFAWGFFILPESLAPERRARFDLRGASPLGAVRLLRGYPMVWSLVGVAALNYVAHDSLPHTFVLYAHARYGWSTGTVGLALAAVGVSSMLVSALLVGRIVRRLGEPRALSFGLAMGTLSFALYAAAPSTAWIFAAIGVGSFWAVWGAAAQSLMTQQVDASEQGRLQGALAALRAGCEVLTPGIMNGALALAVSRPEWRLPGAPFWLSALLVAISLPLAMAATRGASARLGAPEAAPGRAP